MKDSITDLSDSRTEVDSGVVRSSTTGNFGFAFNDSNFSDRVLRIEIMACSYDSKSDSEGLSSLAVWDRNRKRRREDLKKESGPDAVVCPEEQVLTQADAEDVLGCENDDDEVVAMIEESPQGDNAARRNESFSVDCSTVGLILTGDNATRSNSNDSSFSMECSTVARTKTLHISSPILAEKSPFFYKLFSNGMKESEQRQVTLRINESEEAAFMELLDFMYSNTLRSSTAPALLDVLTVADKFEVISCMRECSRLLRDLPMTPDSALLYLDLPSTILTGEAVQPLTDAAKQYLAERYKDISKFQDEVMDLPIAGIEAIFGSDSLQAASEDGVYDFILKWARSKYPKLEDRRPILATRLACLIRFPFMSCRKLRKVLTCADFDHGDASKLVLEALFYKSEPPHRQRSFAASATSTITRRRFMERAYKYRPVKVVEFELPRPQCIVYLDLKKEECTNLWHTGGRVYSQAFHLGGQGFFLSVHCNVDQHSAFHCFGLFLGMQEKGAVSFTVDYEFSARMKPSEDFQSKYKGNYTFTGGKAVGYRNLFGMPWTSFMADDSAYFINGVLHLRAELTMRQART